MRSKCPLVHCITNYVSMDIAANILLAIGASPIMVCPFRSLALLMLAHRPTPPKRLRIWLKSAIAPTSTLVPFPSLGLTPWSSPPRLPTVSTRTGSLIPLLLVSHIFYWIPVEKGSSLMTVFTSLRNNALTELLKYNPAVIRGNASEILALSGAESNGKGVDSADTAASAIEPGMAFWPVGHASS